MPPRGLPGFNRPSKQVPYALKKKKKNQAQAPSVAKTVEKSRRRLPSPPTEVYVQDDNDEGSDPGSSGEESPSGEDSEHASVNALDSDEEGQDELSETSSLPSPASMMQLSLPSKRSSKATVTASTLRDSLQKWGASKQTAPGGGDISTRAILSELQSAISSDSMELAIQETNRGLKRPKAEPLKKPSTKNVPITRASSGESHKIVALNSKNRKPSKTQAASNVAQGSKGKGKVSNATIFAYIIFAHQVRLKDTTFRVAGLYILFDGVERVSTIIYILIY